MTLCISPLPGSSAGSNADMAGGFTKPYEPAAGYPIMWWADSR
jgi:hypothetical protein